LEFAVQKARPNYAINPTPEQALRSNRAVLPARVIAALGVSGMNGKIAALMVVVLLAGCEEELPDRKMGPRNAYESAKMSLARKDTSGYVDALTDDAVLRLLQNAIFLCLGHLDPNTVPPVPESTGCGEVLEKYRFPYKGMDAFERRSVAELKLAIDGLDFRNLTSELENYNRNGVGNSSFAWGFLDNTLLTELRVDGEKASGVLVSPYGREVVNFQMSSTGWRMGWEN
jgi:hypothetical protein